MARQPQPTTSLKQQLDEVILGLQRLRAGGGTEAVAAEGLSTQSNGCSTYSIHCGEPQVVAPE